MIGQLCAYTCCMAVTLPMQIWALLLEFYTVYCLYCSRVERGIIIITIKCHCNNYTYKAVMIKVKRKEIE